MGFRPFGTPFGRGGFGRPLGSGGGGSSASSITQLARWVFPVDYAAGSIPNPYTENGNSLTYTDSANTEAITGGVVTPSAAQTGNLDPYWREIVGRARVPNRLFQLKVKRSGSLGANSGNPVVGWTNNLTATVNTTYGILWTSVGGGVGNICEAGNFPSDFIVTAANDTFYTLSFVLDAVGFRLYIDSKMAWKGYLGSEATLYPCIYGRTANNRPFFIDNWYIDDLPAGFGAPTLDIAAPVSGQSYVATANQIITMDVTAPGSLANECGFKYRVLDANNYWRAYFDAAGAFKLDSVLAGTPASQINVAGAIGVGQTRKIVIITSGSQHAAYTLAAGVPTQRGSAINVSHQDTQLNISPDVGATWSVANLQDYAVDAINYSPVLNNA